MTDWDLLKNEYEVLGKSVKELIDSHNVDPDILSMAMKEWSAPTTEEAPTGDGSQSDDPNERAQALQLAHQLALIPKYVAIENKFLAQLSTLASSFTEIGEAKALAETLAILKPSIMKQADNTANKGALGGGGMQIAIVNKFPIPQLGDKDYVAPNAVVLGEHARRNNGISDNTALGTDYTLLEIEIPELEEMN